MPEIMDEGSDDLAPLFAAPQDGAAQLTYFRTGVVTAWDPNTLENTVTVGGVSMTNLNVLGVADAAAIEVGSVVGINVVGRVYAITGRYVIPGTADASSAVSLLSARTQADTVSDAEDVTLATYGDLPTFGPEVTINVGPSGRCLVILTSYVALFSEINGGDTYTAAGMSYELSGANTYTLPSPFSFNGLVVSDSIGGPADGPTHGNEGVYCWVGIESGLNPGSTTFTAKYAGFAPSTGDAPVMAERSLVVIAL